MKAARKKHPSDVVELHTPKNRQQRRFEAANFVVRRLRVNLFGRGRWRKLTNVQTGRYAEPFGKDMS